MYLAHCVRDTDKWLLLHHQCGSSVDLLHLRRTTAVNMLQAEACDVYFLNFFAIERGKI